MATTIVLKCNKKVQKIQAPSSFEELVSVIKQKFYIKDSKPKIAFKLCRSESKPSRVICGIASAVVVLELILFAVTQTVAFAKGL